MKTFPVHSHEDHPSQKRERIPWDFIKQFEKTVKDNHGQKSLERLAKRGGLSYLELYHAIKGLRLNFVSDIKAVVEFVDKTIDEFESKLNA